MADESGAIVREKADKNERLSFPDGWGCFWFELRLRLYVSAVSERMEMVLNWRYTNAVAGAMIVSGVGGEWEASVLTISTRTSRGGWVNEKSLYKYYSFMLQ